jgi:hypothetical protein
MTPVQIPRHITLVISGIITAAIIFNYCTSTDKQQTTVISDLKGRIFAGAAACRNCHQAIYDSFIHTNHYLSSSHASLSTIRGSFAGGENIFLLDSAQKVIMEKQEHGLYQSSYTNNIKERSERFDIVIGSGKRGQSYLYWRHNELYQLPVSYFTKLNAWVNSPGYTTRRMFFDRVIEARCLECHTTFAKERLVNQYDSSRLILGIDCEKCHGPAADHVSFHTKHPAEKNGRYIINTGILTRQQKLDACALCHSGTMQSFVPAFSFTPGDTLSAYFRRNALQIDSFNLDVHANQYGLMTASRCFIESKTMECGTCHNPHAKETGDLSAYTQNCVGCHTTADHNFCTFKPGPGFSLNENCVNCHMPVKESRNIMLLTSGKAVPSSQPVRTHLIAVYPEELKKWMK